MITLSEGRLMALGSMSCSKGREDCKHPAASGAIGSSHRSCCCGISAVLKGAGGHDIAMVRRMGKGPVFRRGCLDFKPERAFNVVVGLGVMRTDPEGERVVSRNERGKIDCE